MKNVIFLLRMKVSKDTYKMAIIGQGGVGKTSIIDRIVKHRFIENTESTIGAAFSSIIYKDIKYQIWDTAGQERYKALIPMYLRHAKIVLIVYDVVDESSLEQVELHWIPFMKNNTENCHVILIGNKCDIRFPEKEEIITKANTISEKYSIPHLIVSAKMSTNIDSIFSTIDHLLHNNEKELSDLSDLSHKEEDNIQLDNTQTSNYLNGCYGAGSCNMF